MRVLTFASQKGGSGKTTLAGHIAVQADPADVMNQPDLGIVDLNVAGFIPELQNDGSNL